jgi:hypothetical protein
MEFKGNKEQGLYPNDEYEGKPTKQKLIMSTILCLLFILGFIWWAIVMWQDFKDLENNSKDVELPSIVYILYQIGGKWLATAFPILCAALFGFAGIKGVKKIMNNEYEK